MGLQGWVPGAEEVFERVCGFSGSKPFQDLADVPQCSLLNSNALEKIILQPEDLQLTGLCFGVFGFGV